MPDRRRIKGAVYAAVKAAVESQGGEVVALGMLQKMPAVREHRDPEKAVRRALTALSEEGLVSLIHGTQSGTLHGARWLS